MAEFVSRANVSECASPKMLGFEELGDEKIAVEHERGQLRAPLPQDLYRARSVNDISMRRIGDQFVNVGGAKGPITFAENNEIRVCIAQRLQVAAVDTAPIARILLIECQGAGRFRDLERVVGTVIGDDDHAGHPLVGEEITYRLADTFFV